MSEHASNEPPDLNHAHQLTRVNGVVIQLHTQSPTGEQILLAAGLRPAADYALIHWPNRGPTNEVGLEDELDLAQLGHSVEFFAAEADGVRYFTLDEERYAWAGPLTVETVRRLGRVGDGLELWQEYRNEADRKLEPGAVVDLDANGVERLYTKKPTWILQIRDKDYQFDRPLITVRDALERAGFDLTKSWEVKLKIQGEPIRPVSLEDTIDLSRPGIERLRVAPANVSNGDGTVQPRRDFSLLPADMDFLTNAHLQWHTIVDGARWLIVENYPLPTGYNAATCSIAVEIPGGYPSAQLDMFFCHPHLTAKGAAPPQTEHRQPIQGVVYQRWSRHRGKGGEWTPNVDNLESHFALIEHALAREVGE